MTQANHVEAYMLPQREQLFETENYVATPPALLVLDAGNNVWTLGFEVKNGGPKGEYSFEVLCNGVPTGIVASRIERRGGRIRAFTAQGYKVFNGKNFF